MARLAQLCAALTAALICGFAPAVKGAMAQGTGPTVQYGVQGVTAYDPEQLATFAYSHAAANSAAVEPELLAQAIELIYREDGFLLAEVEILQQADGSLLFHVHEGFIEQIAIEGVDEKLFAAIRAYLEPLTQQRPLRQSAFERAIMLANDLSDVSLTTEFDYPEGAQGARLTVTGETLRQAGSITVDNPPREFGQAATVSLTQEIYSLLIPGDMLRLRGDLTGHHDSAGDGYSLAGTAYYRAALGPSGLYGEAYAGNVIGDRDAAGGFVDTELRGFEGGAVIGYPVLRNLHDYAYTLGEYRHSSVRSSGGGIDFRSAVHAVSGMVLYGHDSDLGAPTRLGGIFTGGWRDGAAPAGEDDGDDQFWHVRAAFATSQPLAAVHEDLSLVLDLHGQFTSARLPSVEEFHLGTRNSMRGYRSGEVSGDSGLTGSIELHHIAELGGGLRRINSFAFLDSGFVHNNAPGPDEVGEMSLASAGIGLRAFFDNGLSAHGWFGVPLVDGVTTGQYEPAVLIGLTKTW